VVAMVVAMVVATQPTRMTTRGGRGARAVERKKRTKARGRKREEVGGIEAAFQ
jgi:hypothetical protein